MAEQQIRFDDGASYERMMGVWSRLAGDIFIDWLAPRSGLRWIDIGCGNGAFTELLVDRCAPAEVQGIDPSAGQLAFAHTRPAARVAEFSQGDAMALPFAEGRFDAVVMALVIPLVSDPAKAMAEMVRVAAPGAIVATYVWDLVGGRSPAELIDAELSTMGITSPRNPSFDASGMDALRDLWTAAGLDAIETREITVQRTFDDFDDFWTANLLNPRVGPTVAAMTSGDVKRLKAQALARLPPDAASPMLQPPMRSRLVCQPDWSAVG
jgi:ubiquinone/menaquinone biosynthesis C-methylase UbiE